MMLIFNWFLDDIIIVITNKFRGKFVCNYNNGIIFATKMRLLMKFKFRIKEDTTLEDAENELKNLYNAPVVDIPFNHVAKIAEFIGAELQKSPSGSMERFKHPLASTHGNYFGVHVVHKGGDEVLIKRINFKQYLYPILMEIIRLKKIK